MQVLLSHYIHSNFPAALANRRTQHPKGSSLRWPRRTCPPACLRGARQSLTLSLPRMAPPDAPYSVLPMSETQERPHLCKENFLFALLLALRRVAPTRSSEYTYRREPLLWHPVHASLHTCAYRAKNPKLPTPSPARKLVKHRAHSHTCTCMLGPWVCEAGRRPP